MEGKAIQSAGVYITKGQSIVYNNGLDTTFYLILISEYSYLHLRVNILITYIDIMEWNVLVS